MHRRPRSLPTLALGASLTLAAVGCGNAGSPSANEQVTTSTDDAVEVHLTTNGCNPTTVHATRTAGEVTFVVTNDTDERGEFEILSPAPEILAEEFVDAGETATYGIALAAGPYEIICGLPSDPRAQLTVAAAPGETVAPSATIVDAATLHAATAQYQAFVLEQVDLLQAGTTRFTDAIRSGDLESAKSLYAPVRVPWELIEPVAELFPDSDAVIDSRSDDFTLAEADPHFTGFHALEYGLWAQGTIDGASVNLVALADRLDADIATLITKVRALTIQPQVMTNGAAALIEEAARTKITGEEERYSHTDLVTFDANVRGSQQVFELVEPMLRNVDPALTDAITSAFAAVNASIDPYRTTEGFATYDQVSETDRNRFKTTMAVLSEALARVTGSLGLVVTG